MNEALDRSDACSQPLLRIDATLQRDSLLRYAAESRIESLQLGIERCDALIAILDLQLQATNFLRLLLRVFAQLLDRRLEAPIELRRYLHVGGDPLERLFPGQDQRFDAGLIVLLLLERARSVRRGRVA